MCIQPVRMCVYVPAACSKLLRHAAAFQCLTCTLQGGQREQVLMAIGVQHLPPQAVIVLFWYAALHSQIDSVKAVMLA